MQNKVLTIPNILTIIRILLVPVFAYVYFAVNETIGLYVFIGAMVTDVIDGFIARRFNLITNLGKVLDPLADKLMRITAVTVLVISGNLPLNILIILLGFDVALIISSAILFRQNYVVQSNGLGKAAGLISFVGVVLSFFKNLKPYNLYVIYLGIILVIISCVVYFAQYKKTSKKA